MVPLKGKSIVGLIIANGLTCLRLVCAVFFAYLTQLERSVGLQALAFGFLGELTDVFDGLAARHLNGRSKFGAGLDKAVDKIFVLSIAFSLYFFCPPFGENISTGFFLIVLAIMEFSLLISGGVFALIRWTRLEANQWGKTKMWVEGVMLASWGGYLFADPSGDLFSKNELTIDVLILVAIILAAKSGYDYCLAKPVCEPEE